MKRNLLIIIAIFIGTIAVIVTGNIIVIGEKIAQITHVWFLEYVFYAIIGLAIFIALLLPLIRIHRAPEFPSLETNECYDEKQLNELGKLLAKNCHYIPEKEGKRKEHQHQLKLDLLHAQGDVNQLRMVVQKEMDNRMEGNPQLGVVGINQLIKDWGKTVFMVTAVSQNSKLDTIGMMFMNYKMIESIIMASGFRPSNHQLFKLYANILATSVLTFAISESLTNMGDIAPFNIGGLDDADSADIIDGASDGGMTWTNAMRNFKIPGIIVGSATDGAINLLLTLRIGYITRSYIKQGSKQIKGIKAKRKVRLEAMKEAFKNAPAIVASGTADIGRKAGSMVMDVVKS
jgi:hypothetical protein